MIQLIEDIPRRLALDLEIRDAIPEKGGKLDWDAARRGKCGISTIATWDTTEPYPSIALLDDARLPRVILTEDWLCKKITEAGAIITWNGAGFDVPAMSGASKMLAAALTGIKNVDLMAICALAKVGVDVTVLKDGVPEDWATLVPRVGARAVGFINAGWGLDDCAHATLGDAARKVKGFDGSKVVKAWQQGRYSEVATYNIGDTALTVMLYYHAWKHGWLASKQHGRVAIPRDVL